MSHLIISDVALLKINFVYVGCSKGYMYMERDVSDLSNIKCTCKGNCMNCDGDA